MSENNIITVLNGAVKLRQIEGALRTSSDAVLLAAACPAKSGEHILDLGCGIGTAGLCALHRINNTRLTGIDIQSDHVETAAQNAALNNNADRCEFIAGDIKTFDQTGFDHIICNPPYEGAGKHLPSPHDKNARARGFQDEETDLTHWIKCAFNSVKSGGSLTIVHKADQVQAIVQALGKSFGATEIIPLWPKAGVPAKRVIIRTIKHRKSPATILPGLILHNDDGSYTTEAQNILREGGKL
jgi:tRNA1(Val) A37 N6-methylase TrmN6